MRRENDPDLRAERKSILLALLAAVGSCGMFYARPVTPLSDAGIKVRRVAERPMAEARVVDRSTNLKG